MDDVTPEQQAAWDKHARRFRQTQAAEVQPPRANATARPVALEGGTGPGVLADQTRERPDLIPPALTVVPMGGWPTPTPAAFRPCEDCRTPLTCEESGEDRCP